MIRSTAFLPFLLLVLPACPVDHVILTGDSPETEGEPDPTTGAPGCEDMSPAEICEAHPWGRPEECSGIGDVLECEGILQALSDTPACAGVDLCDYAACADAAADAPCEARPPECNALLACLNAEEPVEPNCCDEHGEIEGAPGLCATSANHKCIDCDGAPALCMTHGCDAAGEADCCLSDDGETVPCDEPLIILPDPIILGCDPPADLCATIEADCVASGVDPKRCLELGQAVCPASKCLACDRAEDACEEAGGDCTKLASTCDAGLEGCNCAPSCEDVTELELPHLMALCFAWPLALGKSCDEPSVGQCLTTLPYVDGCAGITSCQYAECMADLALLPACPATPPESCALIQLCVAAEESPTES